MANPRESERRPLRKKLISLLPFERTAAIRVLDVGAGAGALSLDVLGSYPNAQLVCHDFSETTLAHARQKLVKFGKQVTYVVSDLQDTGWTETIEGTFDAVVSSFVLHTVPDRIRNIYREVLRLVESEGCFLTCDSVAPPGPLLRAVYLRERLTDYRDKIKAERGVEKSLEQVEQELREQRLRRGDSSIDRVPTLLTQLEWLGQAGFDEVDCLWKDMRRAIISGFRH